MYNSTRTGRVGSHIHNILVFSTLFFINGCSTPKVPLAYEFPKLNQSEGTLVVGFARVLDERADFSLDQSIAPNVLSAFATVASYETRSLNCFREVRELNEISDSALSDVDILIQMSLVDVSITVPTRASVTAGVAAGTLLLGQLGTVLAGRGESIVIGHAHIGVTISDLKSGQIHQRQFEKQAARKVPSLYIATPATESSVAGKAIKAVLRDYVTFLGSIVGAPQ